MGLIRNIVPSQLLSKNIFLRPNTSLSWPLCTSITRSFATDTISSSDVSSSTTNYQSNAVAQSIFVTNVSGLKGNSPILIGLVAYFQRHIPSIGFFMPIGADPLPHAEPKIPKHVQLMKQHFNLSDSPYSMFGVGQTDAKSLIAAGHTDELMERVWNSYNDYRRTKDFIIIEGATLDGVSNQTELNARFAAEFNAPVLMISDFHRDEATTVSDMFNRILIAHASFQAENADILGVVLNKVPPRDHAVLTSQLARKFASTTIPFAGGIPADPHLGTARLNEVANALDVKLVYGDKEAMDADISSVMVAAQDVSHFLSKLETMNQIRRESGSPPIRPLVITSKDRIDILLSLAAAHTCGTGPNVAGVLLSDAHLTSINHPTDTIMRCFSQHLFPVMEADMGPYETARHVSNINAGILPDSTSKIKHAIDLFNKHIDANVIASQLAMPKKAKITPASFIHRIHEICKADRQHIVLPEGTDKRVLAAACEAVVRGLARITLLGNPDEIHAAARRYNVDISGCGILDYQHSAQIEAYADALAAARRSKGMSREQALDALNDMNYFGTMMVAAGDADGMVSGATCTTANTIRPALQVLKTPERTLVSSVFFMCLPDRVFVYGDCAVTVEPSEKDLAQIAISSADTATAFGISPRVAMLSYSTLGSGAGPQVDKVAAATALVKQRRPDILVEGPIQYDAAVDPVVAAQKVKGESAVAGKATVCIFPDLNTGNNAYKAVQQSTGALAIGPLMQGLAKPVNDLSRGCTVPDILNTIACTAVQSIGLKRGGLSGGVNVDENVDENGGAEL